MARDSFFLLFTIRERVRDAVARLVVVGLLRNICQNATVTLCLKVSSLHCSAMVKSLSIKRCFTQYDVVVISWVLLYTVYAFMS